MDYLNAQIQNNDKRANKLEQIEKHTNKIVANPTKAVNGIITIPVVVHVIYNTNAENISDAQIQSQIDVLNADFRRQNTDANGTWSQAADTEIEFCMASIDPSGNATSGITRTNSSVTSFGTNDQMKFNSSGGKDAWDSGNYLNMWVCNIGGSILGYAQFPGGSAATDGVVMGYQYFGTVGQATAPFDGGRTATHEVGHWLNLRHIWGDGDCSIDDFVTDTPTSDAPNYGCANGHSSCSSTDMIENYMDYSDDDCMNLFTQGQKVRMRALFDTGGSKVSFLTSPACGATPPPTANCTDGIQNGDETGVDCGGSCAACPTNCTDTEVTLSIVLDNYPTETSWSLLDATGATVGSGSGYSGAGSEVTEIACLADGCYDFVINDAYGDGICCSYGNGSYTLTDDTGAILASGGSFTTTESTSFCLGGTPQPTPSCTDGIQNQEETGVDCGGPCSACPTCNDGIQNQDEAGVDCGGSCIACATCSDGIQNGSETGVDCGGDCAPCTTVCNGEEVSLNIVLDNYPTETSWSIIDASGVTIASGSGYSGAGSEVTEIACLANGCYDFVINDAYGDGICCSYGNGSYTLTGASANVLVTGGSFGATESTSFCVGETSVTPTCTDGIQNGDETGVDCGGSSCDACNTGEQCSYFELYNENFDSGWGYWNDGGSDCRRSVNDAAYANSGSYCVRLRDNTSTSVATTDAFDLSAYEELTVDFSFYARSMENNEDFWLQVSTDGGTNYSTVASWASGTNFNNNTRYNESVTITGTLSSNTRLRFRCDASANADYVYIDDVVIYGCTSSARIADEIPPLLSLTAEPIDNNIVERTGIIENTLTIYPVPTSNDLNVDLNVVESSELTIYVTDLTGRIVKTQQINSIAGQGTYTIETDNLSVGTYLLSVIGKDMKMSKKFVIIQ
ncbi:UNVERIFIED_CONTAM: hypothetical protein GTU68_031736 [Idotea baltica]|nr:hypothetical protein [Idotea baltica]